MSNTDPDMNTTDPYETFTDPHDYATFSDATTTESEQDNKGREIYINESVIGWAREQALGE